MAKTLLQGKFNVLNFMTYINSDQRLWTLLLALFVSCSCAETKKTSLGIPLCSLFIEPKNGSLTRLFTASSSLHVSIHDLGCYSPWYVHCYQSQYNHSSESLFSIEGTYWIVRK